ncbi:hypothetical protein [Microbacterium sp.]|uniref:hypothetical protein n=1 Tax=Microbacterium sp. TaxID=51671 RepID=UPI001AD222C0|nr:hypothetical protein [Microbacterium sp.]MBN9157071.1 hypothetical protein [Microbacterium sp.]MBS1899859.1 hypothetical protein [Actinomycetota bacterium]
MVTVDLGSAGRQRRRTWVLGGALLIASATAMLAALGRLSVLIPVVDPLFALGALVLAVGIGRAGSVTARRPLGTGAVIGLVVVMVGQRLIYSAFASPSVQEVPLQNSASPLELVFPVVQSAMLLLAITAVVQIGRTAVVPRPWNWAPLWALIAVVLARALPTAPFWSPLLSSGENVAPLFQAFDVLMLLNPLAVAFLGVVAIVLGTRAEQGSVAVYSSSTP